jgi:hypothetical protein
VPFLRLVPGGSGRGRADDVEIVCTRFTGEFVLELRQSLDRVGALMPVINSWFRASVGVSRRAGSQRRQRATKSRKG